MIVDVAGEVDIETAQVLSAAVELVSGTATRVVVDLSKATYLDGWALKALVDSHLRFGGPEGMFYLVDPTDRFVRSVFEITCLTEQLKIAASRYAALTMDAPTDESVYDGTRLDRLLGALRAAREADEREEPDSLVADLYARSNPFKVEPDRDYLGSLSPVGPHLRLVASEARCSSLPEPA